MASGSVRPLSCLLFMSSLVGRLPRLYHESCALLRLTCSLALLLLGKMRLLTKQAFPADDLAATRGLPSINTYGHDRNGRLLVKEPPALIRTGLESRYGS